MSWTLGALHIYKRSHTLIGSARILTWICHELSAPCTAPQGSHALIGPAGSHGTPQESPWNSPGNHGTPEKVPGTPREGPRENPGTTQEATETHRDYTGSHRTTRKNTSKYPGNHTILQPNHTSTQNLTATSHYTSHSIHSLHTYYTLLSLLSHSMRVK